MVPVAGCTAEELPRNNLTSAGGSKLLSWASHTRGTRWGWLIPGNQCSGSVGQRLPAQGRVAAAYTRGRVQLEMLTPSATFNISPLEVLIITQPPAR